MTVPAVINNGGSLLAEVNGLFLGTPREKSLKALTFDVSFEVRRGETLCIVGESGSGKSITVRTLAGLLPRGVVARGSVVVNGQEMVDAPERVARKVRGRIVSLIMQDPFTILNPLMTVGTHIAESLNLTNHKNRAALREEILRRLAEVQIDDPSVLDRYAFQLSGGMRQRVAIAAALARDPELLIADEPTTALDATTQREILDLIKNIQRQRDMAVVLVTHDLRLGFAYSDRVIVMYAGNILERGSGEAVHHDFAHPYTAGLLKSIPDMHHRSAVLETIPGSIVPAELTVGRCSFSNRCYWVRDKCEEATPPLKLVAAGHLSSCRRYDDIREELHAPVAIAAEPAEGLHPVSSRPVIIEVDGLSKTFAQSKKARAMRAVDDVSISVEEGESLGIIGESGSGKTTLARCILGLEKPSDGKIAVGGVDSTDYDRLSRKDRDYVRRTVQCVFQDPYTSLNPARTVGASLQEALDRIPKAEGRRDLAELLEIVNLPASYGSRRPRALSGGERQRAAIARALASNPRVLICDEPVSSLDVSVQAQILGVLRNAHKQLGTALLFITHDLGVVRQVTDNVVVMLQGKVVERGPTNVVLSDPQHDYTKRLIAATDFTTLADENRGGG